MRAYDPHASTSPQPQAMCKKATRYRLAAKACLIGLLTASTSAHAQGETPGTAVEPKVNAAIRRLAPPKTRVAVCLYSVTDRAMLYERQTDTPMVLASLTKLFTTAAAAAVLGPSFEWVTTLGTQGNRLPAGVLQGSLVVLGSGDPNFSGRFHDGNPTAIFERWADDLLRENLREIDGDLLLDDTVFDREFYLEPWRAGYRFEWYAAGVAGLSFNDNCLDLTIGPGAAVGDPVVVRPIPATGYLRLAVTAKTVAGKGDQSIQIERRDDDHEVRIGGTLGADARPGVHNVTVHDPVLFFGAVLKETLERKGVRVRGQPKAVPADYVSAAHPIEYVTEFRSPLPETLRVVNKHSQNFYAEQVLKTLGYQKRGKGTRANGIAVVQEAARSFELPDAPALEDGSGLARGNRATARSIALLLAKMLLQPPDQAKMFSDSLAVPGEAEGTLKKRFEADAYRGRVRAKTGHITGVSNLAGYLRTKREKTVAFAILMNDVTDSHRAHELQDAIVEAAIETE